jgi:hypothetical protein
MEDQLKKKENEFERQFNTQEKLHLAEMEKVKETHLKEMEELKIEHQENISLFEYQREKIVKIERGCRR